MSVRLISSTHNKLRYLGAVILMLLGYFNYFLILEPIIIFFRVSSLIGQVLVNKFLSICNCTFEVIKLTHSFFQILYEDSLIFLADATEKCTFVIYLLKKFYLFLEEFGWNSLKTVFQVVDNFFSLLGLVHHSVGTFKEELYFVGSIIWHFFINLPKTVVSNVNGIHEFIKNSLYEIIISIFKLQDKIIGSVEKAYSLFDVALDSIYGLIIGAVLLTIFCVKFKNICYLLSSAVKLFYHQAVSLGISLWSGRFLEQKVRRTVDDSLEDDERLCVVCQYQLKEVIIFPCKHLCLCRDCSKQLAKNRPVCPICRSDITGTLKVYI